MSARFQVESTFTIAKRGLTVAGQIVDGTVNIGDWAVIPMGQADDRQRITGVEAGHGRNAESEIVGFTGVILGEAAPELIPRLREFLTAGQILAIEPPT